MINESEGMWKESVVTTKYCTILAAWTTLLTSDVLSGPRTKGAIGHLLRVSVEAASDDLASNMHLTITTVLSTIYTIHFKLLGERTATYCKS